MENTTAYEKEKEKLVKPPNQNHSYLNKDLMRFHT